MSAMDDLIRSRAGRGVSTTAGAESPPEPELHVGFDGGARDSIPPERSMEQAMRDGFDVLRATRITRNANDLGGN